MKRIGLVAIFLLLGVSAFAQQDSIILQGVSVDSGAALASVRIWAVTFDSVEAYIIFLRWNAPLGHVLLSTIPSYFPPLYSWDLNNYYVNNDSSYVRLMGNADLDSLYNPPIFTNGHRVNIITLRFLIINAPAQTITIDTMGAFYFGNNTAFVPGEIIIQPLTGIDNEVNLPDKFTLLQNYPNPFNAQTTISYNLSQSGPVTLSIYNIMGQKVATLINEIQDAGEHKVIWEAGDVPSGVYFARFKAGGNIENTKMLLLK